jgi:hypothetical protein
VLKIGLPFELPGLPGGKAEGHACGARHDHDHWTEPTRSGNRTLGKRLESQHD